MRDDRDGYLRRDFALKMRDAKLPQTAGNTFLLHLDRFFSGESGTLPGNAIEPVGSLPDAESFGGFREAGLEALNRVAVIKLNGGLGTGMGLDRARSLLPVRDGLSFLDLIARQVLAVRRSTGCRIPILLMNSFRTERDSEHVLDRYPELAVDALPLGFRQHKVPKILEAEWKPASHHERPELEWCPPGHGDLYTALDSSGTLDALLKQGIEYAFVSNADNLGAVLATDLLGYMVSERLEFMMEAADRTAADRKGGHLCQLENGRLALRESAQCPPEERDQFQDITSFRFFNTNNLWVHLPSVKETLLEHQGVIPLPTIVNRKTLDPRDPASAAVIQLETAMGAAISLFPRSAAVRVPRSRFSPVKNTDDLLAVRSDAYRLTDDWRVVLEESRTAPPVVSLDPEVYKLIDEFDHRFPAGPPSLRGCDSLTVEGDVSFAAGVIIRGVSTITAASPVMLDSDTIVDGLLEI